MASDMGSLRVGLSKVDITPRVGVELMGYGAFLNRHSKAIGDRLFARALAASDGENAVVMVSCDVVGVSAPLCQRAKQMVAAQTGVPEGSILIHSIHTHSGPNSGFGIGWGDPDPPYLELLPTRIAAAATEALAKLQPAGLRHAVVPCEGIGYDREREKRPDQLAVQDESWRPASADTTDTEAHVLRFDGAGGMLGFASYFSCHPVIGSESSAYIHGDYPGVATNWLERLHLGSVGLFMQGCHGNINTCNVHQPEQDSLLAVDVVAGRYARQIAPGLAGASAATATPVRGLRALPNLKRQELSRGKVEELLAGYLEKARRPGASDADPEVRLAMVYALGLRLELERIAAAEPYVTPVEVQALRLGDLVIVGAPFEIYHRYKRRVQAAFEQPTLVLSLCNGDWGYAPEKECYSREGNYAANMVPYLTGTRPFTPELEDDLVGALIELVREIRH